MNHRSYLSRASNRSEHLRELSEKWSFLPLTIAQEQETQRDRCSDTSLLRIKLEHSPTPVNYMINDERQGHQTFCKPECDGNIGTTGIAPWHGNGVIPVVSTILLGPCKA